MRPGDAGQMCDQQRPMGLRWLIVGVLVVTTRLGAAAGFMSPPSLLFAPWSARSVARSRPSRSVAFTVRHAQAGGAGPSPEFSVDALGRERLAWSAHGWREWRFRQAGNATAAFKVNYIEHGAQHVDGRPPIVFVHGFGASAFHWRYQIAELAKTHRVYALCLLGFGLSEKPDIDLDHELWGLQVCRRPPSVHAPAPAFLGRAAARPAIRCNRYSKHLSRALELQVQRFLDEVVGEPAVLVGNSLGGIVSLQAAALSPEHVRGLVLMNVPGSTHTHTHAHAHAHAHTQTCTRARTHARTRTHAHAHAHTLGNFADATMLRRRERYRQSCLSVSAVRPFRLAFLCSVSPAS